MNGTISGTHRKARLEKQIERLQRRRQRLQFRSKKFTQLRLLTFFGGTGLGIAVYYQVDNTVGWAVLALTLVIFNIIAYLHRKIDRSLRRHDIWLRIKENQLARMTLDWNHIPAATVAPAHADHPFAFDLDLTGERSLHRLLDLAVTQNGSHRLLDWLLTTSPERETIERRQTLVKELIPMTHFREKLLLNYALISGEQLESDALLKHLHVRHLPGNFGAVWRLAAVLAPLSALLFVLKLLLGIPSLYLLPFSIYVVVYFMNQAPFDSLLDDAVFIFEELKKLRVLFTYFESFSYKNKPELQRLCQPFLDRQNRPSRQLRKIARLNWAVGMRMNPVLRILLNAPLPWDFFVARQMDKLKTDLAVHLERWMEIVFELEALNSLANYGYINPAATLPDLDDSLPEPPVFAVRAIGHPLIPEKAKRRNDFTLEDVGIIALITGSNMSGKSTFLKTVGINLSLAFAGGPVDAKMFRCGLFRLFTCIHINDSLTDGFSFFYREVHQLKRILGALDKTDEQPLFFLIDEIFKGTNNRERLIGSRSYIRALAPRRGLGLISTHDLELTHLAKSISHLRNYHFREDIRNGKMVFDYRLRPGPCPTTNALKIMQMEGLPVEDAQ